MTDRKTSAGGGGLAPALLVMAVGVGLLAAAAISLLPYLIMAGSMRFAARHVKVELMGPQMPARVRTVLAGWIAGLRSGVHTTRGERWQRPPLEGNLT